MVMQEFELVVVNTSELAALELENEIGDRAAGHAIAVDRKEPELTPGTVGDPGLVNVVLSFASDAVPAIAAVLAAWITARRRGVTRARKIVVTRQGTVVAEIEMDSLEKASDERLTGMIDDLVKGSGDGTPEA
jgi:hypothetical protein